MPRSSTPTASPLSELSELRSPTIVNMSSPTIVNMSSPFTSTSSRIQFGALETDDTTHSCGPGCSDSEGSEWDGESSSDSEDYNYDSDAPLQDTAGRIRGGAARKLRRSRRLAKKKRKPCPRKGNARPSNSHRIPSGVIEASEGPFVPEEMAVPEGTSGQDNGAEASGGSREAEGERGRARGKGKGKGGGKGGKRGPRTKPKDAMTLKWETVLREASTPFAIPLLARVCIMSGRNERNSLCQLVHDLEVGVSSLSRKTPSGTSWLNTIVDSIDFATSVAKMNELHKMFSLMNLALELDQ